MVMIQVVEEQDKVELKTAGGAGKGGSGSGSELQGGNGS